MDKQLKVDTARYYEESASLEAMHTLHDEIVASATSKVNAAIRAMPSHDIGPDEIRVILQALTSRIAASDFGKDKANAILLAMLDDVCDWLGGGA